MTTDLTSSDFINVESAPVPFLFGTANQDTVVGTTGSETLSGGPGDDELSGDDGDDSLNGDEGNDLLRGGPGDDSLSGGDGDDTLGGGSGTDRLIPGNGRDLICGTAAELDGDTIIRLDDGDTILVEGEQFDATGVLSDLSHGQLDLDTDGDVVADLSISIHSASVAGDLVIYQGEDGTSLSYGRQFLGLADKVSVSSVDINGVTIPEVFRNFDSDDFEATVRDLGIAAKNKAIGVYDIDNNGRAHNVRILFASARDSRGQSITLDDVGLGDRFGLFIIADGAVQAADWLSNETPLSFKNSAGELANINDRG